jgi:hypothetical protein
MHKICSVVAWTLIALLFLCAAGRTDEASPSPTPSPTPTPVFELHVSGSNVFIDQATSGSGQVPPEGAAFANGNPAAPMTPFDWFTTGPVVPGVSATAQYLFTASWHQPRFRIDASALVAGVGGDPTNAFNWGEPLLGTFDPAEGRSNLSVPIVFPTHAANNDVSAGGISLPYDVRVHDNNGRWSIDGGYVQTSNYDPFVFVQPPYGTYLPSTATPVFETIGPGFQDLENWTHLASALPMLGADATFKLGGLQFEATDGLLPSPEMTSARLTGGNVVYDRGDAGRFSASLVHLLTTGDPQVVPVLFGSNPTIFPGAQGSLAQSTLGGQAQTIAGISALVHPHPGYDVSVELGKAWYNASLVARPGSESPGTYQHYSLTRNFNKTDSVGIEYYRMDPRYATAVLPYGVPMNVWGIAWAYPGPWLKGTYQLVTNAFGGSDREGLRGHATIVRGSWTAAVAAYDYGQVEPSTAQNLTSTGFVEVDYLLLAPGDVQFGRTKGFIGYVSWAGSHDTISADYASDSEYRAHATFAPGDGVDMHYPQWVFAEQHKFSPQVIGTIGYASYQASGFWSTTPVDGTYSSGFLGLEMDLGRFGQVLIQLRRYGIRGAPSIPEGPPPTLNGTGLLVDHHFSI